MVDMDMSTPLMKQVLGSMGCDFYPLLIAEEKMGECERLAAAVVDSPVDSSVVTVVVVTGMSCAQGQARPQIKCHLIHTARLVSAKHKYTYCSYRI